MDWQHLPLRVLALPDLSLRLVLSLPVILHRVDYSSDIIATS